MKENNSQYLANGIGLRNIMGDERKKGLVAYIISNSEIHSTIEKLGHLLSKDEISDTAKNFDKRPN